MFDIFFGISIWFNTNNIYMLYFLKWFKIKLKKISLKFARNFFKYQAFKNSKIHVLSVWLVCKLMKVDLRISKSVSQLVSLSSTLALLCLKLLIFVQREHNTKSQRALFILLPNNKINACARVYLSPANTALIKFIHFVLCCIHALWKTPSHSPISCRSQQQHSLLPGAVSSICALFVHPHLPS